MSSGDLPENLKALLEEFGRSGLGELHIRKGDFEVYLSREPGAHSIAASASGRPAAQPAPAPPHAAVRAAPAAAAVGAGNRQDVPDGATIITAPNLGTFYRSPKPGAPPYVEVGAKVAPGDEVCLIEVMKLFTAVRCESAGTVHSVLVEDGAMVEAGQPLFAIVED